MPIRTRSPADPIVPPPMTKPFVTNQLVRLTDAGRMLRQTLLACLCVALVSCAATKEPDPTEGWSAEKLYQTASDEMDTGRYADAVKYLQKLEARYPFGKLAQQAQIDTAYAHYKDGERGLALVAIDRFLKMHPEHPQLAYMYYLKGLVNFNEENSIIAAISKRDLSERDLRAAREAFDSFGVVAKRFPNSKYAADSRQRMQYLVNSIAAGEVSVARFYYQRGAYVAAINRAQAVVSEYQRVPAVEEALVIMVLSYDALGLDDLRDGVRRVLDKNFPDSAVLENGLAREEKRWWQVWR